MFNRFGAKLNIRIGEVHGHDGLSGFDALHFRQVLWLFKWEGEKEVL